MSFRNFSLLMSAVAALCLPLMGPVAQAAGMVPETPVVIVDQGKGEATLNIRNTDDQPALLYSSVLDIPEDTEPLLLVNQPVARVEPGQNQQVRFILHVVAPLQTERLKRVVFEGIKARPAADGAQISMGVRQNIPVIIRPAGLAIERMSLETTGLECQDRPGKREQPQPLRSQAGKDRQSDSRRYDA